MWTSYCQVNVFEEIKAMQILTPDQL